MTFLAATASFPQHPRAPGSVRAGTAPKNASGEPAWARPQVSWPFLAAVPLTVRTGPQSPASFNI